MEKPFKTIKSSILDQGHGFTHTKIDDLWDKKQEQNFRSYYGEDANRILAVLRFENEEQSDLIEDIMMYGMYLPDKAGESTKAQLEDRVRSLLQKSADILERVHEMQIVLKDRTSSLDKIQKDRIENYINDLHMRAIDLLKSRFSIAQQQNEGTVHYLRHVTSIEKDLEISDQELFLNLYWFKYAREKVPPPSIEDIVGNKVDLKKSDEISLQDQQDFISLYEENWKHESPELRTKLIDDLKKSFIKNRSQFVIIRNHKEMVGFIRFEDFGPYEYASGLNIKRDYQTFGIAEAVLESSLRVKSLQKPVHAQAKLGLNYTEKYLNDFDAFATSIETVQGVSALDLIFSPQQKNLFMTSHVNVEQLQELSNNPQVSLQKFNDWNEIHIPAGKVLTRCLRDPLDPSVRWAVYESIPMDYETNIKTTG